MRDRHMKLTLQRASAATINMEPNLHHDVSESIYVFLCCTARIRELPVHIQNSSAALRCYGNFPYEEFPKFVNILITIIKEEHFERDVNVKVKVIRNLLK